MKVIVSHDVDSLYVSDHFKDLIIPKFYIRSIISFLKGRMSIKNFAKSMLYIFNKRLHHIPEIIEIDKEYNIPSIFFFGMRNGLGMSYSQKKAKVWIQYIINKGFDVGVHGIEFEDYDLMKKEYDDFSKLSGLNSFGIRNHYVRYNDETFKKQSEIGYLFDSSYFNKNKIELKGPYKVGDMWEFPLYIMEVYLNNKHITLAEAKKQTINIMKEAEDKGIKYFTFLFHDNHFCDKYPFYFEYYKWFVEYCRYNNVKFISYREAIKELEYERK